MIVSIEMDFYLVVLYQLREQNPMFQMFVVLEALKEFNLT